MENDNKIDLLYKEYIRLNQRLDNLIDGSLDDFKLLGFIWPVILGVGSLITTDNFPKIDIRHPLEIGFGVFLSILLVISIIAFRDFLKLSLINYHIYIIKTYEEEISKLIGDNNSFKNVTIWNKKFTSNHSYLYSTFILVTALSLLAIPTLVLFLYRSNSDLCYWFIYLLMCISLYILHFSVGYKYLKTRK